MRFTYMYHGERALRCCLVYLIFVNLLCTRAFSYFCGNKLNDVYTRNWQTKLYRSAIYLYFFYYYLLKSFSSTNGMSSGEECLRNLLIARGKSLEPLTSVIDPSGWRYIHFAAEESLRDVHICLTNVKFRTHLSIFLCLPVCRLMSVISTVNFLLFTRMKTLALKKISNEG